MYYEKCCYHRVAAKHNREDAILGQQEQPPPHNRVTALNIFVDNYSNNYSIMTTVTTKIQLTL